MLWRRGDVQQQSQRASTGACLRVYQRAVRNQLARAAGGTGALSWLAARRGAGGLGFGLVHLLLVQADPLVDCAMRLAVAVWWLGRWCSHCLLVRERACAGEKPCACVSREDVGECARGRGA